VWDAFRLVCAAFVIVLNRKFIITFVTQRYYTFLRQLFIYATFIHGVWYTLIKFRVLLDRVKFVVIVNQWLIILRLGEYNNILLILFQCHC